MVRGIKWILWKAAFFSYQNSLQCHWTITKRSSQSKAHSQSPHPTRQNPEECTKWGSRRNPNSISSKNIQTPYWNNSKSPQNRLKLLPLVLRQSLTLHHKPIQEKPEMISEDMKFSTQKNTPSSSIQSKKKPKNKKPRKYFSNHEIFTQEKHSLTLHHQANPKKNWKKKNPEFVSQTMKISPTPEKRFSRSQKKETIVNKPLQQNKEKGVSQ